MRTMQRVGLVALDTGKATVNGTKEARSRSGRRPNRKTGTGMTFLSAVVTPYKRLGKISDILHLNNKNNQLERRVRPPKDIH